MNPSFPLAHSEAKQELREMGEEQRTLQRPLIIASGIHDPGIAGANLGRRLRRTVNEDARVVRVSFLECWSFDSCRDKLIRAVQEKLPSDDPDETVEVDVVGVSMGGLVARYAALPSEDGRPRLRIHRLFTIATPHRGASLAKLPTLDSRAVDMRAGSEFLRRLDEARQDPEYEIFAYARLGDVIVGAENAAPPGRTAWWVANPPFSFAHLWASTDPRFIADIARRLRGETPYATVPAAPLPSGEAVDEEDVRLASTAVADRR